PYSLSLTTPARPARTPSAPARSQSGLTVGNTSVTGAREPSFSPGAPILLTIPTTPLSLETSPVQVALIPSPAARFRQEMKPSDFLTGRSEHLTNRAAPILSFHSALI